MQLPTSCAGWRVFWVRSRRTPVHVILEAVDRRQSVKRAVRDRHARHSPRACRRHRAPLMAGGHVCARLLLKGLCVGELPLCFAAARE